MSESKNNKPAGQNRPAVLSIWKSDDQLHIVGGMEEVRRRVEDGIFSTLSRWKNQPQNEEISVELTNTIKSVVDQGFGVELIVNCDTLGKSVQLVDIREVGGFVDNVIHLNIPPLTTQRKPDKNYGAKIVAQKLRDVPSLQYRTDKLGTIGVFRPDEVVLIQVYDTSSI